MGSTWQGAAANTPAFVNVVGSSNTGTNAVGTLANSTCATRAYCFQLPDATLASNTVVVFTEWNDSATSCNASTAAAVTTTNNADTYTQGATAHDTTNHIWISVFYKVQATTGTRNMRVTFAGNCTHVSATGAQIYNVNAVDVTAGNQSTTGTTSWTSGSLALTASDIVLADFCATNPAQNIASYTAGTSMTLRTADRRDGCALEYQTGSTTINPAMTSGTSAAYVAVGVSFKANATGTAPSGLYLAGIQHQSTAAAGTGPFTFQFPSTGNLLAVSNQCGGTGPMQLSSVSDGTNTWKNVGTLLNDVGDGSIFEAENASSSSTLTLTLTTSGTGDCTFNFYDIAGAATSNALNAYSFNCDNASGPVAGKCFGDAGLSATVTPLLGQHYPGTSTSNGAITLSNMGLDFNTCVGMGAPAAGKFDSSTVGSENLSGPYPVDENNCWGHFYNTDNSAQTVTWNVTSSSTNIQEGWALNASFVAPAATLKPSSLGNTACFSASSPFTCSYTPHRTGSVIAIGVSSTGSGTIAVSDSAGNTITTVDGPTTISGLGIMKSAYIASVNTASADTFTITIGTGGGYQAVYIDEVTNVTALDLHNIRGVAVSGGSFSTATVGPSTAADEYMFGWAMCFNNCMSAGFGTSMQGLNQDGQGNPSEFRILTATGSFAANFKDSGTNTDGAGMMTFK